MTHKTSITKGSVPVTGLILVIVLSSNIAQYPKQSEITVFAIKARQVRENSLTLVLSLNVAGWEQYFNLPPAYTGDLFCAGNFSPAQVHVEF